MIYLLLSYLFGTILFAVVIGKLKGIDLQQANSGNLGARNAGRTLGKWAFILVAVGDGLKGLIVVVAGRMLELPELTIALAVIAVVLGHLYPFWNRGKGGKGVATVIGAMVAFSPLLIFVFLAGFLLSLLVTKSATLSMTAGFIVYGLIVSVYIESGFIVTIALVLVIWKQRHNCPFLNTLQFSSDAPLYLNLPYYIEKQIPFTLPHSFVEAVRDALKLYPERFEVLEKRIETIKNSALNVTATYPMIATWEHPKMAEILTTCTLNGFLLHGDSAYLKERNIAQLSTIQPSFDKDFKRLQELLTYVMETL